MQMFNLYYVYYVIINHFLLLKIIKMFMIIINVMILYVIIIHVNYVIIKNIIKFMEYNVL